MVIAVPQDVLQIVDENHALAQRKFGEASLDGGEDVDEGLGVTALPSLTFTMFKGANLTMRPLIEPVMRRHVGVVTLAGRTLSEAPSALIAHIRESFADWLANQRNKHCETMERSRRLASAKSLKSLAPRTSPCTANQSPQSLAARGSREDAG
jgi:hypothetical protein